MIAKITSKILRPITHNLFKMIWRSKLNNSSFSIISQNCVGGCIYNDLGMRFSSPTVNLYIVGEDFIRLAELPEYYLSIEAIPKGYDEAGGRKDCPIILVGDIKVYAVHYSDPEEAAEAWNRRKARVNLNNLFIIANAWNLNYDSNLIKRFNNIEYPKVLFSDRDLEIDCQCLLTGERWYLNDRGVLKPNLTDWAPNGLRYFENVFDFVSWLNNGW